MSSRVLTDEPPTYLFGRRDRGALLLGFRLPQIAVLVAGLTATLLGLVVGGGRGGLAGSAVLIIAAWLAVFPIQGRPVVDWVRPVANFTWARATKQHRYLGGPWAIHRHEATPLLDLPGIGHQIRVLEVDTSTGPVAVLRVRDRWTAVLQVRCPTYALADRASQERRVAAWGSLMAQMGQEGSRIAAVQWLERTVPDSGHDLAQWWQEHGDRDAPYADAYEDLINTAGPAATRHEIYVAVSVDAHKARRAVRQAGGGPEGTTRVLMSDLAWVQQGLSRLNLEIVRWLGPGDLGWLIRTQYDPAATEGIDNRPGDRSRTLPLTAAGPTAAEASWNHYRTDSGHHAVYWIAEWPAMPVEAAWCYPLLALGGIRRTVTVTSEPVPPSRSLREVRSQRVQKRADDTQRRRLGQVETAQDDEEYGALERRERELVRGHTEYRFTGWITVTGSTIEELEASCAQVEQAAVRSALEVRRIHGEVDQAFTVAAMPTAQGVRA